MSSTAMIDVFGVGGWLPVIITLLITVILSFTIAYFTKNLEMDEFGREEVEMVKKEPNKTTLKDWIIGILIFLIIIVLITLIIMIIGDKLNLAVVDCTNCTLIN